MMHNSILCLQDWCCSSNSSKTEKGKVIKAYLKAIGFSTQLIPALCQDILEGKEVTDSPGFPSILRNYTSVNVEMNSFQTMPMHMCFLGIEKSLIGLTSILANRKDHGQNAAWHKLVNAIQESQETINSVYLVWCLAMKFTDMEKKTLVLQIGNPIITWRLLGCPCFISLLWIGVILLTNLTSNWSLPLEA
jgi:hypothetical protein